MRGISTILEFLLITLLLITLVSLLWLFTSGTIRTITQLGTNQTQRTQEIFSTCMIVDSTYGNKVYLKNCGYGVITNDSLSVYLDDTPLTYAMTPQKIGKGEVGTITTSLSEVSVGDHDLKITNPNSQTVQRVETALPSSCVLALDFDEGSGTVAYDSSGHHNDGTLINNPSWVNGKYGYGLNFDGVDDYVKIGNEASLNLNDNNEFTLEALIFYKKAGNAWPIIIGKGAGDSYAFQIRDSDRHFGFWGTIGGTNIDNVGTLAIPLEIWSHVAVVFDGNKIKYFLNNIEDAGPSISGYVNINSNDLFIGNTPNMVYFFNGTIDNVRIFNKALTPNETVILKMK